MEELILKHSLINAVTHNGKADIQAVIGKVIAEKPELKGKIKDLTLTIKSTVEKVNSLSMEEQKKWMKKLGIEIEKKEIQEVGLPELPNAEQGKVVMRLAPFPSGPLHIGNARMVILNDEYVKRYKGKLLLIFDDTIGSEEKRIIPEAYKLIQDGIDWLGVKYHKIIYKSDRMAIFYKYAEELIEKGFAYVCTCSVEEIRKNRKSGIACECRNRTVNENLELWRDMLNGKIKEGKAVVRLKTDMKHPNPAFRDRILLRIVEREHPRVGKKYRVWPMLEFSWAIDDFLLGITHILRGKQLVIEDEMEKFIWKRLGWKQAEFIHYGMLRLKEGGKLSKSEARRLIEKGKLTGWDDPRTWSLQALRRRGIQPQAIRNFIIKMGMSLADVTVPTEILYAENRKIIDPIANRYFCVFDPVEITVEDAPKIENIEISLHPDFPERGKRKIYVNTQKIYVEKSDLEKFEGKEVGLINLFSIKLGKTSKFISEKIKYEIPKIHWVSEPNIEAKIVMPDGSMKKVLVESAVKNLKVGDLVQFYRIGFCRVDNVGKEIVLYFTHK